MSSLSEVSIRRIIVVSIINDSLLSFRFSEAKTFDVFSKLFVSLVLTWTSSVYLGLVGEGLWSSARLAHSYSG